MGTKRIVSHQANVRNNKETFYWFNLFTEKGFAISVLDDYAVHLMPKIRQALFKKGYFLVVIGGGITGDIQINDTHCHRHLKSQYRDMEMNLMLG